RHFIENGYLKVYALKGGWSAWNKAGYPIEKK
ncbi:MAG: rhodanese-like sulfurtransferase, partial [Desulfobacterales bacterium]